MLTSSESWNVVATIGYHCDPIMGVRTGTLVDSDVILIVDDSRFIAHAYSKVLAGLGYRVMIACDGRTGIFAAESCKPSLILLDMIMPDMDGLAVLRTLKRTPSTTNIPVLITSSLSKNNADKLILEGAAGYFEKGDMTEGKLEHAVSEILKKRLLVPDGEGGLTTEL